MGPILSHELLRIASDSIEYYLKHRRPLRVDATSYPEAWQQIRATFVTLHVAGELRGCIGTLEARDPLIIDVSKNAVSAATRDTRFDPIRLDEVPILEIHISILNPTEPIDFTSEQDLLQKIRPGVDGLILEEGAHHATFLPVVWESLPNPTDFLRALKRKAGLAEDFWSNKIKMRRYLPRSPRAICPSPAGARRILSRNQSWRYLVAKRGASASPT